MVKKYVKKTKTMTANQKANLALKKVKKLEGDEELKNVDNAGNIPDQLTTETRVHLTNISQGDTHNQRNALKITLHSLYLKLVTRAVSSHSTLRVLVVMDKMNMGTAPNLSDILQGASVLSPKQIINQSGSRFWIMFDKVYPQAIGVNQLIFTEKYIKLQNQCHYTGTSATDEREGNIWMYFISDKASSGPTIDYYARIRFSDD